MPAPTIRTFIVLSLLVTTPGRARGLPLTRVFYHDNGGETSVEKTIIVE
jgi:hypothetical protein